jgi:hypothetical protein
MTGGLTARAKILLLPGRVTTGVQPHAGMTGTLDDMFGKLRDAAAAHDDD